MMQIEPLLFSFGHAVNDSCEKWRRQKHRRNEVTLLNPFLNIKDTNADNFLANRGRMRGCLHKVVGLVSPFKCNVGFL